MMPCMLLRLLLAVLLFACLPLCMAEAPIVLVISMDGVRHDYPHRADLPGFARMLEQGASAERLTPVYPSNTFPGHVSLATGTHPDVHGVVDNWFIDRERGTYFMSSDTSWLQAEPVWIAAERQGVPAATYFWVGSEQDWRGQGTSERIAPFDGGRPDADKVAQILRWLARPEATRPRLIMSYFAGTDRLGHRYGPDNASVSEQLSLQDQHLQSLLRGIDALDLWSRLTLLVVSDHGMTRMGDHVDISGALANASIDAQVSGYTVGHVHLRDAKDKTRARNVLSALPLVTVVDRAAAQANYRFAFPGRVGDLVVLAEPPAIFSQPGGLEGRMMSALRFFGWDFGGHGYDPNLPDMGGIFLALGRGVRPAAELGELHQIDLAPTVATLLGIEPPLQSEGQSVNLAP